MNPRDRKPQSVRYGPAHRKLRAAWAKRIDGGESVPCARCRQPIHAGMKWDLGHVDGGSPTDHSGPEHSKCNRASMTHARQAAGLPVAAPEPVQSYGTRAGKNPSRDWTGDGIPSNVWTPELSAAATGKPLAAPGPVNASPLMLALSAMGEDS